MKKKSHPSAESTRHTSQPREVLPAGFRWSRVIWTMHVDLDLLTDTHIDKANAE
jgi:hypothetical protein